MKPTVEEVLLSKIKFDESAYPRKDHDPVLVQRYAAVLDEIEARQHYLSISANEYLLDGKHRWLAYRKVYTDTNPVIKVFRYAVSEPHERFKLACTLNNDHGWQISDEDKKRDAITLHNYGDSYDDIAKTLGVGKKKVSEWLSRTVKEEKDRRNQTIFEMWLACYTQEEIANAVNTTHQNVSALTDNFATSVLKNQNCKAAASHATGFKAPIYNIWKQQEKTMGSTHPGNSEIRWLDNLLYLYTEPFDIVVDPFAGGGSTIDTCKKRFRRYWISDRKPIVERENEIHKHDLVDGLPPLPRWKDVKLVYLDPPYWKQSEGQYSNDPTDLANMSLEDFTTTLEKIINGFGKKLKEGYIALIIQPTQWNAMEKQYTDHIADMLRVINLPLDMRYSVPYESQQYNAQMVEWAKTNKKTLVLTREIIVWRVGN